MDFKRILIVLPFFILLVGASFAQENITTTENIATTIYSYLIQSVGIIFILIFIFILLLVAGLIKFPKGLPSPALIIFIILIILFFVVPFVIPEQDFKKYFPSYAEVPENFKIWPSQTSPLHEPFKNAIKLIGLPEDWAYVPAIIYLFILPFAAIYALVWAFLASIAIFPQGNVNRLLALIIALLTIPVGAFVKMVWLLFGFLGAWSVVIFATTFVLGIFYRGAGIVSKQQAEYKKQLKKEKDALKAEIATLEEAFKSGMAYKMQEEAGRALRGVLSLSAVSARSRELAEEIVAEKTEEGVKSKMEELIKQLKKEVGG
jgi:hypothetical protein